MTESLIGSSWNEVVSLPGPASRARAPSVHLMTCIPYKFPRPGEEKAPTFDPDRPEGLGRFFELMEDLFADAGLVDGIDKKRNIVKYLDPESENQWRALSMFWNGTFEDFKSQVMASYPKAEEFMKGSITALKRKIQELGNVLLKDRNKLMTLVRIVNTEIWKLNRIIPPIHSNKELVELFLNGLAIDFANQVAMKLSMQRLIKNRAPDYLAVVSRDPEDLYDIQDVIKMAEHVSLEHASPLGKFLEPVSTESRDKDKEMIKTIDHLTESIALQAQYNHLLDKRLMSLQSLVDQSVDTERNEPDQGPGAEIPTLGALDCMDPVSVMDNNEELLLDSFASHVQVTAFPVTCYYCGIHGHKSWECTDALHHLKLGWVKRIGYQFRMPDGSKIPSYADMTMKLIVENLSRERKRPNVPGLSL